MIRCGLAILAVLGVVLSACGGDDGAASTPPDVGLEAPADGDDIDDDTDDDAEPPADPAPDLTPEEVCDALPAEDLVAVVQGELREVRSLDNPPQCSISYVNSDEVQARPAAVATNLLVSVPTSDELEGRTGAAGLEIATQYAFFEEEPTEVDVGDIGLTNGQFLYFALDGRVVGIAAGSGMTEAELVELAEVVEEALAP